MATVLAFDSSETSSALELVVFPRDTFSTIGAGISSTLMPSFRSNALMATSACWQHSTLSILLFLMKALHYRSYLPRITTILLGRSMSIEEAPEFTLRSRIVAPLGPMIIPKHFWVTTIFKTLFSSSFS